MKRPHRVTRVTGGKVAWTNTSSLSDQQVLAALRFVAKEVSLDRCVVHVKRDGVRSRRAGTAYQHIPSIANMDGLIRGRWSYLIVASDFGGYLYFIGTLAHEAKHVEGYRRGRKNGEAACNAFGAWVVERWEQSRAACARQQSLLPSVPVCVTESGGRDGR